MSRVMRKLAFYICENKDADQLRSNCAPDQRLCFLYTDSTIPLLPNQRLCFHYTDSTIPLLPKSEISGLQQSSVAVLPAVCQTWSKTQKTFFFTTWLIFSLSSVFNQLYDIVLISGSDNLDQMIKVMLGTAMFVGGFIGFLLDNTVPGNAYTLFALIISALQCERKILATKDTDQLNNRNQLES